MKFSKVSAVVPQKRGTFENVCNTGLSRGDRNNFIFECRQTNCTTKKKILIRIVVESISEKFDCVDARIDSLTLIASWHLIISFYILHITYVSSSSFDLRLRHVEGFNREQTFDNIVLPLSSSSFDLSLTSACSAVIFVSCSLTCM